ncbi:MAG TPA: hypothetical protein VKG38_18505 [Solirubrobacteraceae bacterium]|nr:hypothetical protein [Solirubrobacteraceae bacterium]
MAVCGASDRGKGRGALNVSTIADRDPYVLRRYWRAMASRRRSSG